MPGTDKEFETVDRACFLISLRSIGGIDTPYPMRQPLRDLTNMYSSGNARETKMAHCFGQNGVISMNRIAETFWIAAALVLGAALAAVAVPIVAIVCFLALALPVAMRRVHRHRYCGDFISPSTRKGPASWSRLAPTIETTYTVVGRS
ncbi:hypothetical protein [Mesorhizobium sp. NZP2077]|uniref:hypothetical protein n=1 Tax=Mesorhizobium sp. NZP2077 TaxID=2483404 RepID=UPI0015545FAB|nr:hypothetical protein [Mesorhizobium sp. NZP2077]QKD15521.1 hypothetical protein HGP13_10545 [Mesorhizobium sp. NZP2077]